MLILLLYYAMQYKRCHIRAQILRRILSKHIYIYNLDAPNMNYRNVSDTNTATLSDYRRQKTTRSLCEL